MSSTTWMVIQPAPAANKERERLLDDLERLAQDQHTLDLSNAAAVDAYWCRLATLRQRVTALRASAARKS